MSNGHACCILGVCCDARSVEQSDALVQEMVNAGLADEATAQPIAAWILSEYDLAPVGTLDLLKKELAKIVRKADKQA